MKGILFVLTLACFCSCKKNNPHVSQMQGLWIEKSLRLDSIQFTDDFYEENRDYFYLNSQPYIDVSLNPNYPINHSSIYGYYLESGYIFLHNSISSTLVYNKFDFQLSASGQSFTIKRFYDRNSLPAIIEFEKIK